MLRDGFRQFQVISRFRPVAVHAGEQDLAGAQALHFHGPLHCVDADVDAPAVFINVPAGAVRAPFGIDSDDHTLAPELVRRIADQFRPMN